MGNKNSNYQKTPEKNKIKKIYGLSPMQEGMLFHSIMEQEEDYYCQQMAFTIEGEFNTHLFEKSLNIVIERHDVLRTNFVYYKVKRPQQVVFGEKPIKAHYDDLSYNNEKIIEKFINDYLDYEKRNGFDLIKGELIKLSVFKCRKDRYRVIISNHHIILDGWSISIVTKEVFEVYNMLLKGESINLNEEQPYNAFINWIKKIDNKQAIKYWIDYLDGYEQIVGMPSLVKTCSFQGYINEDEVFRFDKDTTNKLKNLAKQSKVTLNVVIQSIIGILLQKYNNTDDVVVGAVVSGRNPQIKNIQNAIGLFINILPVRVKSNNKKTFTELLEELQKHSNESRRYEHCSLVEIQTSTNLNQGIFNSIIEFENYPISNVLTNSNDDQSFKVSNVQSHMKSNYNFNLSIFPADEIEFYIRFNAAIYERDFIKNIKYHMYELANQLIRNPNICIKDIEIMTKQEKERIISEINSTKTNYPKEKTIQQLFEEQVKSSPDNIAVVYEDKSLTYKDLNRRANNLSKILIEKGVNRGSVVSLILKRSEEMIISILAVLKSGASYLPIDPENPKERIVEILEDLKPKILITDSNYFDETNILNKNKVIDIIFINSIKQNINEESDENPKVLSTSEDIACIIYTSGSTGKPKGNLITHYNISRVVKETNYIKIDENQAILQLSNYAFDGSLFDIYGSLLNGSKLVMVNSEVLIDMPKLCNLIESEKITMFFITTALFNILVDININCLKNVNKVLFGGERVSVNHVKKALNVMGPSRLIHVYGPTEGTVFTTYYNINKIDDRLGTIPIGKPIANSEIYILDSNNKIQPIGSIGELYISGDGISKGYLNRPELTDERFIANPYKEGNKLYKTGDVVRMLSSGDIEFLDRVDSQVKLRGFRIELGEVETQLLSHENIKEAVVLCRQEENGVKYLQGYIVANKVLTLTELRSHLEKTLPDYMIPAYFSQLEDMPLTSNGKIDKRVLEDVEKIDSDIECVEARNHIETILVNTWKDILGASDIGIDDNYFFLGGDSIKAIQIASRLQKEELQMKIKDLFQHPTIRELSKYIESKDSVKNQQIVEGEVKLTPIQHWFFNENFTEMNHFNQCVMLYSKDGFKEKVVECVLKKIIKHHDALRMIYRRNENGITQYNRGFNENDFSISVLDFREEADCEKKIEETANKLHKSMDIHNGPLIKANIFKTLNGDHLLLVIHHLVVDGVSWRIILGDFAIGYMQGIKGEEIKFQEKSTSFKEWSEKLYDYSNSDKLQNEINYWNEVLNRDIESLPKLKECDEYRVKDTESVNLQFSEEETRRLIRDVNKTYNTEINDILIAALGLAINKWCGNKTIMINMEGHGRENIIEDVDINRTVGWFTTMYPVSIDINKDMSYYIKNTKDSLNRIPNNGVGYGIIKYLSNKEVLKQYKNIEISFNYLGQFDEDINTEVFELSQYSTGEAVSNNCEKKYLLDINGVIRDRRLTLTFDYNGSQYLKENIEELAGKYKVVIIDIINHCLSKTETEYTPTDFVYNNLSIEALEDITNDLDDII